MKIGIITFHWATNYGAILQSFALQKTLQGMGHDVKIIDYKPKQYEPSLWRFFRNRQFLHPINYLNSLKKERLMKGFREKYLNCTPRFYSVKELQAECEEFDVLISGSDQVMNPSFLVSGENGGSTAYFLDFGREKTKRITYAVSFGTIEYPKNLLSIVSKLIKRFDALSVRETSGKNILTSMGRNDSVVVADPTILLKSEDYDKTFGLSSSQRNETLVYMLHNRLSAIQNKLPKEKIKTITTEAIEEWIQAIKSSEYIITNSFHGMVFSILYHVPFTIVLKSIKNEGMNDRFFTLLNRLGLQERIMSESNYIINKHPINWDVVEQHLDAIRQDANTFLKDSLNMVKQ